MSTSFVKGVPYIFDGTNWKAKGRTTVPTGPVGTATGPGNLNTATGAVSIGSGTYTIGSDFVQSSYPVYSCYNPSATSISGASVLTTYLEVAANSMSSGTQAKVTGLTSGQTNQLWGLRVDNADLLNFTYHATAQQQLCNGIEVYKRSSGNHGPLRVKGVKGSASAPPGEIFPLAGYRLTGSSTWTQIEIDGTDDTGTPVSATLMGINSCTGTHTFTDGDWHDSKYGYACAMWDSTGTWTFTRMKFRNNQVNFNMEANRSGSVIFNSCQFTGSPAKAHLICDSDLGSMTVTLNDPVWDNLDGSGLFIVCIHAKYGGAGRTPITNTQLKADIKLFQNGQDVTASKLKFVTNVANFVY